MDLFDIFYFNFFIISEDILDIGYVKDIGNTAMTGNVQWQDECVMGARVGLRGANNISNISAHCHCVI